ncbi:MAG TPA: HAD family hydrolase [Thermomicrobiaceae bacterium]|nr:HAD family hydrolase [Thermomicrobiaceae bacterium]
MPETNSPRDVVFLLDVDDTLLDNDQVEHDLRAFLQGRFGATLAERFWAIFEALRAELGYADFLGALQRFRLENLRHPHILETTFYLLDYPFAERLYPDALAAVARLDELGTPVILTDGDVVFQPHKIAKSGIWQAVAGKVLIYIHKEAMLEDIAARYPARHYVLVDDKVRILAAIKAIWGERVTTVFPRQGHYAHDAALVARYPAPDLTVERIGDLLHLPLDALVAAAD